MSDEIEDDGEGVTIMLRTADGRVWYDPAADTELTASIAEAARADAAALRSQLERFERVEPIDWPGSENSLNELKNGLIEQIQQIRSVCRRTLAKPNPGAPLLALCEAARAFAAVTAGLEATLEGAALLAALKELEAAND